MATWKVAPSSAGKSAGGEFFERSLLARVLKEHCANPFTFQAPFARKISQPQPPSSKPYDLTKSITPSPATLDTLHRGLGIYAHLWKYAQSDLLGHPWLFEHKVSHIGFDIPIDYRDRREIKRSMGAHHYPDLARECEDRPEDETRNHRLFDAREP